MKFPLRSFALVCLLAPFSAQAQSTGIGGSVGLSFGNTYPIAGYDGSYPTGLRIQSTQFSGSIGMAAEGGFGWQADIDASRSVDNGADFSQETAFTLHGFYDLGSFTLGGFAGAGVGNSISETDIGVGNWFGIEAARDFGDFVLAGHLGVASSDNDHNPLDYQGMPFAGVQGRYFIGDRAMLGARLEAGQGIIHGDILMQTEFELSGMVRLGQSDFYGTAAWRYSYFNANYAGGSEGEGGEKAVFLGMTMLFGDGGLRSTYGASTPMMGNRMRATTMTYTAVYD